jgi:hypothetical protein
MFDLATPRHSTGLEIIGIGVPKFIAALSAAFQLLEWTEVWSVSFTSDCALVSQKRAVHHPLMLPSVRSLTSSWDHSEAGVHLWNWIEGIRLPVRQLLPAFLPDRQSYNHVEPELAKYPSAPTMVDGRPNSSREKAYLYHRGWMLTSGMNDDSLEDWIGLSPIWARWGPFDPGSLTTKDVETKHRNGNHP